MDAPDWDMVEPPMHEPSLAARLAALETTVSLLVNNLNGHITKEEAKAEVLSSDVQALRREVREVTNAIHGVVGTDWAELADEFGKSKKLTARIIRWLAHQAKPLAAIATAAAAIFALFQCTPGKGNELPATPTSAPAPVPARAQESSGG